MVKKELLPLQLECTMLFQTNPTMVETLAGIGVRLGRKTEDLQSIVEALVQQGILQKLGDEASPLFCYKEPVVTTTLYKLKNLVLEWLRFYEFKQRIYVSRGGKEQKKQL
ncbi:hypothetical protein [Halobacillus sp. Marseille-P3879]|uniref:hypothetical protein n=1 Tax=Halobacillus sp. Marseille-P3879 TaxID=2045014 RepID=UPI001F2065AA|nr:hypothetical protein [Halobacillus sp. Marseille-P3879]